MPFLHYKLIILFSVLLIQTKQLNSCSETDLQSLLDFKRGLTDPRHRLSSWTGDDCCSWQGITCNESMPARVVKIDLRNTAGYDNEDDDSWALGGDISPSLLHVNYLSHLDLSFNDFWGLPIPTFFGSFPRLRYLNLSAADFGGTTPSHLGNLSSLYCLDLSYNGDLRIDDSRWIENLKSLEYIDLTYLTFSEKFGKLLESLRMLPSLTELHMSRCTFLDNTFPTFLPHTNFSSLSTLDLSYSNFTSSLPMWIFNITTLEILNLRGSTFQIIIPHVINNTNSLKYLSSNIYVEGGGFPQNLQGLCKLQSLYLSWMNLTGQLSTFQGILKGCSKVTIQNLDLRGNSLTGTIPNSFGNLYSLTYLDISSNSLEGTVTELNFANLKNMKYLDISLNKLSLEISHDWLPPFQLETIGLGSCKLGPKFLQWLQNQFNYFWFDMSYSEIADCIPPWFWDLSENFVNLDLSHNQISTRTMLC
ncbi:hypothetical protein LUZ61_016049 [Rhynchospora tenuis]|uniref:Leucine-rich repeat-containing N-terminal plant-type domain-containing protein n=1 Tax=Rhynchospora tenuis TaxID=198213 RepID=A0AAD5Z4T7_9POAL|nr:hypothetical protein LUZ61_016049 [Rhynchospora tenuis]